MPGSPLMTPHASRRAARRKIPQVVINRAYGHPDYRREGHEGNEIRGVYLEGGHRVEVVVDLATGEICTVWSKGENE